MLSMTDVYIALLSIIISVIANLISHYIINDLEQKNKFMEIVGICLKYILIVAAALYVGWLIASKILNYK